MQGPPWLSAAQAELGVRQYPPGNSNPRIMDYHNATNLHGYDDKASWCSSFVNWCFVQTGIEGTGSAIARSWLNWGRDLAIPQYGCVVVLSREDPDSWKGHVGFFLRYESQHVYLLGGNQLKEVREHCYPTGSVLGYRWPSGALTCVGADREPL
jgi:uncharacterized protein (TIGR02594 family)